MGNNFDDHLYREIGTRIRRARLGRDIKQVDLAGQIGLTRVSIVNVEQGRQRLPIHTLYAIAGVIGVRPHDLLPDVKGVRGGEPTEEDLVRDFVPTETEGENGRAERKGSEGASKKAPTKSRRERTARTG